MKNKKQKKRQKIQNVGDGQNAFNGKTKIITKEKERKKKSKYSKTGFSIWIEQDSGTFHSRGPRQEK